MVTWPATGGSRNQHSPTTDSPDVLSPTRLSRHGIAVAARPQEIVITRRRFDSMRSALVALFLAAASVGTADAQSSVVAIVTNSFVISGGNFPTTTSGPTGAFTSFTFVDMPV